MSDNEHTANGWTLGKDIAWSEIVGRRVVEASAPDDPADMMKVHGVERCEIGNVSLSNREAYTNDAPYADWWYFVLPGGTA